jgi:hypothetical protein
MDSAGRALACGGLTPLWPLERPVAQAAPRRAARGIIMTARSPRIVPFVTFDGDKSPAQSDAKASHSKEPLPHIGEPFLEKD